MSDSSSLSDSPVYPRVGGYNSRSGRLSTSNHPINGTIVCTIFDRSIMSSNSNLEMTVSNPGRVNADLCTSEVQSYNHNGTLVYSNGCLEKALLCAGATNQFQPDNHHRSTTNTT